VSAQSELADRLAPALHWKMDQLDGESEDWASLTSMDQSYYQACVEWVLVTIAGDASLGEAMMRFLAEARKRQGMD
jgi:hypothetical protein